MLMIKHKVNILVDKFIDSIGVKLGPVWAIPHSCFLIVHFYFFIIIFFSFNTYSPIRSIYWTPRPLSPFHTALLNWFINLFMSSSEIIPPTCCVPFWKFIVIFSFAPRAITLLFFLITRFINTRKCLSPGQLRLLFLYLDISIFISDFVI